MFQQTFLNNPGERGNTDCIACPSSDKDRYKIFIDVFTWSKLQNIMYNLGAIEYSAYLLGTKSEDGCEFKIDDYYVPSQQVTSVKSEITEDLLQIPREIRQNIIGHIHSHHEMSISSSGTDLSHMNYPLHIIIGFQGRYSATIRTKTECSKFMRITDIPITFIGKKSELIEEEMKKIEKIEKEYSDCDLTLNLNEDKECFWCGAYLELFSPVSPIVYDGNSFCSKECFEEFKRNDLGPVEDVPSEQKQPLISGNWEIKTGMVF